MAIIRELDQKAWKKWVESRPPLVLALCKKFPPNRLYKMTDSGHRVTIRSYSEDGTLTVNVTGEFNRVAFNRQVFGVQPKDLEECELPGDNELLGTILTDPNEVNEYIDSIRPEILKSRKLH